MKIPPSTSRAWLVLLVVLVLLSCALVESRGTLDVLSWIRWIKQFRIDGPVAGYANIQMDYPPLMTWIFYNSANALSLLSLDDFIAVKVTVLAWTLAATALVLYWTRDYRLTALFHLAFLLNSVCLGYADIIVGLLVILALHALNRKRIVLFASVFALAVFVKWQTLVLAPFLLVYLLRHHAGRVTQVCAFLLPPVIISAAVFGIFGYKPVWSALHWALHHEWLSANALNIPWVLTFCYRTFSPETFGGLHQGEITYITTAGPPLVFVLSRYAATAAYAFAWFAFLRSTRTFSELLLGCIAGYLAYFTLNTGVHENHLFLAVILGFVLVYIQPEYWRLTIALAAIFNLNQFLFYGLTGHQLLSRVIAGVDVSLLLAVTASALFARWYYRIVRDMLPGRHRIDGLGRECK